MIWDKHSLTQKHSMVQTQAVFLKLAILVWTRGTHVALPLQPASRSPIPCTRIEAMTPCMKGSG